MDHVTIGHLKILRDLVQTGSVSRAADLNDISQSAASQSLKSLEKQLGVELIDRGVRPLKVTRAGEICFQASREIVLRYEEMEAQLQALETELAGVVRVASIYSIGLYEMARLKTEFEKLYPKTHIHLDYLRPEGVYQAIQEDRADIGLVSYPNPGRELKAIPWRLERMTLVCHPSHPLASRRTIRPEELSRDDFISFDPGLSIRRAMDRFFREHGIQREVALEFDNIQMIKEALSIGQGVSILPERTVRQEVADGRLISVVIETDGLRRPVGVVHHRKKVFSPTMQRFLEFLLTQVESEEGEETSTPEPVGERSA